MIKWLVSLLPWRMKYNIYACDYVSFVLHGRGISCHGPCGGGICLPIDGWSVVVGDTLGVVSFLMVVKVLGALRETST